MKKIFAYIIAAAAIISFAPGLHAQAVTEGVVTDKYVSSTPDANGYYKLTLESYVTGRVVEEETEKATDFVLALDYSGSMNSSVGGYDPVYQKESKKVTYAGNRTTEKRDKWTYSNTNGNSTATANLQWFYKHTNGNYYPVYKANNLGSGKNVRALWVVISSKTYYLKPDGSGLSAANTLPSNCPTTNSGQLYTGTLYKGWCYATYKDSNDASTYTGATDNKTHYYAYGIAGNAAGTANSQFYYYDEDGSALGTAKKYYPVHKVNNLADANGGTNARALYIESGSTRKYLRINGLSTSYDNTIVTDYRTISMLTLYRGWTYNTITEPQEGNTTLVGADGGHYIYYSTDAKYYPLHKETLSVAAKKYQVYFVRDNGQKRYLTPLGTSTAACAYSAGGSVTIYFGDLYTVSEWKSYNRFTGLSRAVQAFAEGVYEHATEKNLKHRIALVAWGSPRWISILEEETNHHPQSTSSNTAWPSDNSGKKMPSRVKSTSYPYLNAVTAAGKKSRGTRILQNFKVMNTEAGLNAIKGEFATYPTQYHEATCIEFGMAISKALFDREWRGKNYASATGYDGSTVEKDYDGNSTWDAYEKSSLSNSYWKKSQYGRRKVLVVVSDGEFNGYDWTNFTTAGKTTEIGSASIGRAKTMATSMKNDGVTIYMIHVNTKGVYQEEKDMATSNSHVLTAKAYDETLADALLTIVNQINTADVALGSTAHVTDIVTKEFSVPGGTSTNNIKTYTAQCTGVDGNGQLTFANRKAANYTVKKKTNAEDGTTTISVTGFDYAANYCGLHTNGYDGLKLIIEIPILPDPDLIGGTFYTNTTQSVIYDKDPDNGGKPVATFPRPQLTFDSINLRIVKKGLQLDDSAVFAIYRKAKTSGATYETTPYMTVLLSGVANGADVEAQITGLNANYYYKIKETTWSWRYTSDPAEISTENHIENPFTFTNTLDDDGAPKNGEDVVHNVFTF